MAPPSSTAQPPHDSLLLASSPPARAPEPDARGRCARPMTIPNSESCSTMNDMFSAGDQGVSSPTCSRPFSTSSRPASSRPELRRSCPSRSGSERPVSAFHLPFRTPRYELHHLGELPSLRPCVDQGTILRLPLRDLRSIVAGGSLLSSEQVYGPEFRPFTPITITITPKTISTAPASPSTVFPIAGHGDSFVMIPPVVVGVAG